MAIREGWAEFCHTGTSIAQAYSTIVFPVCSNFYFKTEGSFKLKTEIRKVSLYPITHRGRADLTATLLEHLSWPKDLVKNEMGTLVQWREQHISCRIGFNKQTVKFSTFKEKHQKHPHFIQNINWNYSSLIIFYDNQIKRWRLK